ncbi:hypothetical protein NFI96_002134 [Prochilodus magdalenae]|nr:hypothetical protein NFI96_002134 [Prochilodus magdalenae]
MEEAYTALYQEFLRLQSLCLKQAAMLQHLTATLRRHQGLPPVRNGDLDDFMSIPVQCTEDDEDLTSVGVPAQAAQMPTFPLHSKGDPELLPIAGAMDRLQLDSAWGQADLNKHDQTVSTDSTRLQETQEPSILDELRQAEQRWHSNQPPKQTRRPWSSSFVNSEMLSQAGGLMMSGFALQSQVCEFCHAVFPGHTTTKGEFLRHLTTHT